MTAIRFVCSNCEHTIKAKAEMAGHTAKCPNCKKQVSVPQQNEVNSSFEDDYGLAAMSVSDVDRDELQRDITRAKIELEDHPSHTARNGFGTAPVSRPRTEQDRQPMAVDHAANRRYPVLRAVSLALRLLAWMSAIIWFFAVAAILLGIDAGANPELNKATSESFLWRLANEFMRGATGVCVLIGASELIKVAIDIQNNTLASARK